MHTCTYLFSYLSPSRMQADGQHHTVGIFSYATPFLFLACKSYAYNNFLLLIPCPMSFACLFVLAAETPLIHRFDLSCGADHLWSEIGAISLITNRLLSIIGVRRHWGLVQQPWTSMWAPLPCPHLVYMLFSINCEPQSKFDRIPIKFPPNCVVVRFGQRCCWQSAFMTSMDPISSMMNPLTITSLIYLHACLQNFIARNFKMKDISSSF